MKLVVVESPYAGNVPRNFAYLRAALADSFAKGEAPFASHGLYTQPGVLRDEIPDDRARGIAAGLAWGDRADLCAVYEDLGVTPGMEAGIARATERGQPVERRTIRWDESAHLYRISEQVELLVKGATFWSALTPRTAWAALVAAPRVAGPWEDFEIGGGWVRRAVDGSVVASVVLAGWVTPKYPAAPWLVVVEDRSGADAVLRAHGWVLA